MKAAILQALLADRTAKRPVALITDLDSGVQALVGEDTVRGELALDPPLLQEVRARLASDRSGMIERGEARYFVQVHAPPLRLILVGAVHIAQPLVAMARLAGWEVVVVDPRGAFATSARFPNVTLVNAWPDDALRDLRLDRRTAVVTLTHDPKLDDPALNTALRSEALYIGALGSRKTHAQRLERLRAEGFTDSDLDRIRAPVGLAVGAITPAEIAVSILAEMTRDLRTGSPILAEATA